MNWTYVILAASAAAALYLRKRAADKRCELIAHTIKMDRHGFCTIVFQDGNGKQDVAWNDPKTATWYQVRTDTELDKDICEALCVIRDKAVARATPKAKVLSLPGPKN